MNNNNNNNTLNNYIDENHWFSEKEVMWPGQQMSLKVKKELLNIKSEYQHIQVFDSETYGRVLVLDGVIQLTERDEHAYQEMLAHVALFSHTNPKKILIIGGGDGGILREVLRHDCVEEITMVELDEKVIEVAKQYFQESTCTHNFIDPRLNLIIGDGAAFLQKSKPNSYDVVLVDSSDPVGPASVLFENDFYNSINNSLSPGGIMCNQGECIWLHLELIKEVFTHSKKIFAETRYFYTTVPTYPSGQIGFILNRKKILKTDDVLNENNKLHVPMRKPDAKTNKLLSYYTPEIHSASFVLPKFAQDVFDKI